MIFLQYEIYLNNFQGPMEVLLSLIKKHKIDIYDIPIAQLTDEFLKYINNNVISLNTATEFLEMAATLLEIKSKMLLFHKLDEEEEEDPRDELVDKLLEYQKLKEVSEELKQLDIVYSKMYYKKPANISNYSCEMLDPQKLTSALDKLLIKHRPDNTHTNNTSLKRDDYPVEKAISQINDKLKQKNKFLFSEVLGECFSLNKLLSFFLAVLELIRQKELFAFQENYFGEIYIEGCNKID